MKTLRPALAATAALLFALAALAQEVELPSSVDVPAPGPERPDEPDEARPDALPQQAPVPAPSPAEAGDGTAPAEEAGPVMSPPVVAEPAQDGDAGPPPVPEPRPEDADAAEPRAEPGPEDAGPTEQQSGPEADETAEPETPPDPRSEMPASATPSADELACRQRLDALGVAFETRPPESDASGCALPWPVTVSGLGAGIALDPPATLNCETAEATARFAQQVVAGETRAAFSVDLKSVRQVSGYVCRPRAGLEKLSEHAFGNAIDFGAFVLEDGREIAVARSENLSTSRFLARVRQAACGPFTTVLGPGTDEAHADHFHFDLAPRRPGSTYCR